MVRAWVRRAYKKAHDGGDTSVWDAVERAKAERVVDEATTHNTASCEITKAILAEFQAHKTKNTDNIAPHYKNIVAIYPTSE
jgi:hypothetical protein